jgi:preprotein translocase subunit SecG
MGASFGSGGSQSVFGAGGGSNFMTKLTTAAAVIFMLTSLTLAYLSGHMPASSIMSGKQPQKPVAAPANQSAPAVPVTPGQPQTAPAK